MPLTAAQVDELVTTASVAMQELQNELGSQNIPAARVRFPRGFIGTAATHRHTLPNLGSEVQRRNASYGLMTLDIFRWLLVRTDLSGPALSMIAKESIAVLGALCEWLTKAATHGHASSRPYAQRTAKLVELGRIEPALKVELDWVWGLRCNEHLHEVTELEVQMYSRDQYNRAFAAYSSLRNILVAIHGAA
jgi:hypothetical protein